MGKVIGIVSTKGGSGKTVTAFNIAALLSSGIDREIGMKRKILLLDITDQYGINYILSGGVLDESIENTSKSSNRLDCLLFEANATAHIETNILPSKNIEGLYYIPKNVDEMAKINDSADFRKHLIGNLSIIVKQIINQFDYIIIDSMLGFGSLNKMVIYASDSLLIPSKVADGTYCLDQTFEIIKKVSEQLGFTPTILGILPIGFNDSAFHKKKLLEIKNRYSMLTVFPPVPDCLEVFSMADVFLPLQLINKDLPAVSIYQEVTKTILSVK